MASQEKKQGAAKTKPPIVIKMPGFSPDTRLKVFSQAFHVHSLLLKIHSTFFRKFLDSADKILENKLDTDGCNTGTRDATLGSNSVGTDLFPATSILPTLLIKTNGLISRFTYDWITKVDEDGTDWHLICAGSEACIFKQSNTSLEYKGDPKKQIDAFANLLLAIHGRPYIIENADQLNTMTNLADYYCSLPVLSRSLDGALLNSPNFCSQIAMNCQMLLVIAEKLRSPLLFREALIWVVGPNTSPRYQYLEDRNLRMVARCAHAQILEMVTTLCNEVIRQLGSSAHDERSKQRMKMQYLVDVDVDKGDLVPSPVGVLYYPWYFRRISDDTSLLSRYLSLENLLENRLALDPKCTAGAEEDELQDYFLCAHIDDKDLPWDVTEIDW
ncbi:hypothetical protein EG329_002607 [Mollisiaceae sp. DMI_Dod_QoI]|nr:hypothetical protein EG329_002607 [Helotiales sp. DMI_Dod_QoI]